MTDVLWSLKEKREYLASNARLITIGGVMIRATPSGEPLVLKVR